jgi:hypothetical protein
MNQNLPNGMGEDIRYQALLKSLHIVLVLTYIGSGCMFVGNFLMGIMLPSMNQLYDAGSIKMPEIYAEQVETSLAVPQPYYLISSALYALSLAGAIMMWKLRKNGFHFYTTAQLLIIATGIIFMGREGVMLGDIMLSVLFIGYYFLMLRNLGIFGAGQQDTEEEDNNDEEEDNRDEEEYNEEDEEKEWNEERSIDEDDETDSSDNNEENNK